jgi:hypothetical protein
LLQHDERLSFEQQVDFVFFAQQDAAAVFEQQLVDACTTSLRTVELLSPQPQLAAGRDCARSITTAIQALACVMIGLDAAASMVSLSFRDSRNGYSRVRRLFSVDDRRWMKNKCEKPESKSREIVLNRRD